MHKNLFTPKFAYWLLALALGFIPLLSPHVWNTILWTADIPAQTNIWEEFRSIMFFLVDIPLFVLTIISLISLLVSRSIRNYFVETLSTILKMQGGWIWLVFCGWAGISIIWAVETPLALYNTFHLLLEVWMAIWIAVLLRHGWLTTLLVAFTLAAVLHSGLAIIQIIQGESLGLTFLGEVQRDPDNPFGFGIQAFRASGFAFHPNNLGGFLVIGLFAAIMLLINQGQRGRSIMRLLLPLMLIGLIGLGLLATSSRSAIVGVAAAFLLAMPLLAMNARRRVAQQAIRVMLIVGIVGLVAIVGAAGRSGNLTNTLGDRMSVFLDGPDTFASRLTYAFTDTTAVIEETPILGTGAGNLMVKIGDIRQGSREFLLPAHNAYWMIWAELGIIGLGIFLLGNVFVVMRLHPANPIGVIGWGLCLVAIFVVMIGDFYFWGDLRSRLLIFWALGMWWGSHEQTALPVL